MESQHAATEWRLIISGPAAGPTNMATDEAILHAVGKGDQPATLRLYAWEPACLSLGYGQRSRDTDLNLLNGRGWDIVRRPTGGRAILHTDELTYAVIAPNDEPIMAGGVLESYRRIAKSLVAGLELLAAPVITRPKHERPADAAADGPVCFEVPSNWEITVNDRKLVGSAQKRTSSGVLQHGTIPLTGDLGRITDVLNFKDQAERVQARASLLEHACTLQQATGNHVSWERAAAAIRAGFEQQLGRQFRHESLSSAEQKRAQAIAAETYGRSAWTHRRR
jgi:lipoate-protein ligase A